MNIRNYFIASATLILAVLAFGSCKEYEDDLQKLGGRVVVLENSNLGYTKAYIDHSLNKIISSGQLNKRTAYHVAAHSCSDLDHLDLIA